MLAPSPNNCITSVYKCSLRSPCGSLFHQSSTEWDGNVPPNHCAALPQSRFAPHVVQPQHSGDSRHSLLRHCFPPALIRPLRLATSCTLTSDRRYRNAFALKSICTTAQTRAHIVCRVGTVRHMQKKRFVQCDRKLRTQDSRVILLNDLRPAASHTQLCRRGLKACNCLFQRASRTHSNIDGTLQKSRLKLPHVRHFAV